MSPYPNEHSARLLDPDLFETCRRTERESEGKKYGVLTCKYKKGKIPEGKSDWAEQSYRYPITDWTEEQARVHCESKGGVFEPAEEEIKLEPKLKSPASYFWASPVSLEEDQHIVDIEILREGSWAIKKAPGGVLDLTKAKLQEFVKNFDNQIVGEALPIDLDHKEGKTVGWLRKMWLRTVEGVGHLIGRLDITDPKTQTKIKEGTLRYFSPSLEFDYQDPESKKYFDLIRSGGLTNWPFIKNMQPAKVLNFSEIELMERKIEGKRKAEVLRLKDNEISTLKETGKTVALNLIKTNKQLNLRDKVILKLEIKAKIDRLSDTGALSPFEAQKCRELSLTEPKAVDLAIELLDGRGPAVELGQQSILTPRRRSLTLNEQIDQLDTEQDPEKRSKLLNLIDTQIENMKEKRGMK